MNILFLIFIILAYVNLITTRPFIEDNPDKYLDILNKERFELAQKFNITNMHKLSWSIELSLTAHKVKCPYTASNRSDFESFIISDSDSDKKIITELSDLEGYKQAQPLQTQIGCNFGYQCDKGCDKETDKKKAEIQYDTMESDDKEVAEVKFTKFGLCFIGPHGNPSMAHFNTGNSSEGHTAQALTSDKKMQKNGVGAYQWLISVVILLIM